MQTDPNMGLTIWDQLTDLFDHTQLATNLTKIGAHDHTSSKGVQIPTGGIGNAQITTAKIATGAVGTTQLADDAVTTVKIGTNQVTGPKLAAGSVSGGTGNTIAQNTVTDWDVAPANKDGAAGTPSLRTLGTSAQQATAGNDGRLSNGRTPTGAAGGILSGTYPNPDFNPGYEDAAAGTPSLRTLGTGANQAAPGNDSRLSNSRVPTGSAGGALAGTYPNPDFNTAGTPTFATISTSAGVSIGGELDVASNLFVSGGIFSANQKGGSATITIPNGAASNSITITTGLRTTASIILVTPSFTDSSGIPADWLKSGNIPVLYANSIPNGSPSGANFDVTAAVNSATASTYHIFFYWFAICL